MLTLTAFKRLFRNADGSPLYGSPSAAIGVWCALVYAVGYLLWCCFGP